jgi:hypothetical protein
VAAVVKCNLFLEDCFDASPLAVQSNDLTGLLKIRVNVKNNVFLKCDLSESIDVKLNLLPSEAASKEAHAVVH